MSDVLRQLRARAAERPRRIVFPEPDDPRVLEAAEVLARDELAHPLIIGREAPAGCEPVIPEGEGFERCVQTLTARRAHKGMTEDRARDQIASQPLLHAALCVQTGLADASVAGSVASTANVIRAALMGVGTAEGVSLVSSFFLMCLRDGRCLTYADCGVVPDPDAEQLAEIARVAAASHTRMTGESARVAMLSFSTRGSAQHALVDKVRQATERLREQAPDLAVEGEIQFDAAFDPAVGQRKAPESPVAGQANVFIFPNLDAGNIAYKITQRLGGAQAIGPLVQGLAKPCMDLSRGCSVQDIVDVACVASVLAE